MFRSIAKLSSSKKGVWITLSAWIMIAILLTFLAPGSRDEISVMEGSGMPDDALSEQANRVLDEHFPGDDALPAILVFTSSEKLNQEEES